MVTKVLNSTHDKKIKYSTQLIVFTCGPGVNHCVSEISVVPNDPNDHNSKLSVTTPAFTVTDVGPTSIVITLSRDGLTNLVIRDTEAYTLALFPPPLLFEESMFSKTYLLINRASH